MEWNRKPVFGIGINDVPEYTKGTKPYLVWKSMLARCYSPYTRKGNPAYNGCSVCDEWLTFSKFKEWFDHHYIPGTQLDKDILVLGNKVYSPNTCCFVPQVINKLFKGHSKSGELPCGVQKQYNKYKAQFRADGITYRASFDNLADAERFYSNHRKQRLIEIAEKCLANKTITELTYNAILSYAV